MVSECPDGDALMRFMMLSSLLPSGPRKPESQRFSGTCESPRKLLLKSAMGKRKNPLRLAR
jgi:hypothetical protein